MEILSAAQRSADLTGQLLAFARRQTAFPRLLDLNDTIGLMLKMLRRLIGEEISIVFMPGAALWQVKIDPVQMDQILANLCVNARDAITGTGKIVIETRNVTLEEPYCAGHSDAEPGDYVQIDVSDDGCGMDQETISRLFEPFFTTKEPGKGTGLGLATVYGIVKQNRGFINVYSEKGHGSCFKIFLPRAEGIPAAAPAPEPVQRLEGKETVLLVEDEQSILNLGKMILERYGYRVIAAENPTKAMEAAKAHKGSIELLITDVVMPEMNGKELKARLEALKPGVKVLYMSGYTADIMAQKGIFDKGSEFIQKPFTVRGLAAKVRKVLDSTRSS
jgi:CheY-like chemotaxis protein